MPVLQRFRWIIILAFLLVAAPTQAAPSLRLVTVEAWDGVRLAGNVWIPDSPGLHPAIVLTTSWGQQHLEYVVQARRLAARGYVVLSYTARGFLDSGGEVMVAGPEDVADLSAAIDWLIANTPTDPRRIGAAGISYGAGIALLGSAFDERIRVVAALSSWSDIVYSLYSNETRHRQSVTFLMRVAGLTGRTSSEMDEVLADFQANRNIPDLIEYGRIRSAASYIDRINANHPAILLASGLNETIFPINQLADFWEQLSGPKRLELRPGDHADPEMGGLLGLDNEPWDNAVRWFDHHLQGMNNGIDRENAVVIDPRSRSGDESYPSLSELSSSSMRLHLGTTSDPNEGRLQSATCTGWSQVIAAGVDTIASAGTSMLSGAVEAITGIPPHVWLPLVDRSHAAVWVGDRLARSQEVRGIPQLHLTVVPSSNAPTTFIAYLYDVNDWGIAKLISHLPYTLHGATAGRPVTIDADFFFTAYDVPAGHKLALVVDTVDPLYFDAGQRGTTLALRSPSADASFIELPLR